MYNTERKQRSRATEEKLLRQVRLFYRYGHINVRNIGRIFGEDPVGKVHELMDYTDRKDDVADPWYSGKFDISYRDIYNGCVGLPEKL